MHPLRNLIGTVLVIGVGAPYLLLVTWAHGYNTRKKETRV